MLHERAPARATARANIALAKYWGKSDLSINVPAVPSISLTLEALVTETEVEFDPALEEDCFTLDGKTAAREQKMRAIALLDRVRARAGIDEKARVKSRNRFPTAAGLASSASGFAALAAASTKAAGMQLDLFEISALARRSSASAARSVFGGFVALDSGGPNDDQLAAEPLAAATHWDVRLVVALTATGPKDVGSTEAMERSRATSPYYDAWVEAAPVWCETIRRAVAARDLESLGVAMEQSTLAFHCCAITSKPSIPYWAPGTLAALRTIEELRARGFGVWSTMDAGPHVKALCEAADAERVARELEQTPGVLGTLVSAPGAEISVSS